MAGQQAWHFEQVNIKDSDYAKKCGISGECYFYVSKGHIKISQLDNKTSLDLSVSRIRNWGATSTSFFLDLGSRSPAGAGRLEMTHKDPNTLRLLVRDTTSSKKNKSGRAVTEYAEEEDFHYVEDEESNYGGTGPGSYQNAEVDSYHRGRADSKSKHGSPDGYEKYPSVYNSLNRNQEKNSKGVSEAQWHQQGTVRSEEALEAINVRDIGSVRHVAVGEEDETYTIVKKDQTRQLPKLPKKKL